MDDFDLWSQQDLDDAAAAAIGGPAARARRWEADAAPPPAAAPDILRLGSGSVPGSPEGAGNDSSQGGDDDAAAWDEGADGADQEAPSDVELVEADEGLSSVQVIARIEELVSTLVEDISEGRLPQLTITSRARSNTHLVTAATHAAGGAADDSDAIAEDSDDGEDGGGQRPHHRLALGNRTQTKTLLHAGGMQAMGIARVFKVLEVAHELLRTGRTATQRDLYYRVSTCALFKSATDVATAVQDVVALLRVPRCGLGICCAPRGAVSGQLSFKEGPGGAWQDCGAAAGSAGRSIPGDMAAIQGFTFRCTARYVIVIEKDAIFQRLTEDGLATRLPSVLVTGKGIPDLGTRAFVAKLHAAFPELVLLGLVDWNPSGVVILCCYKFGNARMGLEAPRYALPGLHWLGATSEMLADTPESAFKPLTQRDVALIRGLRQRLVGRSQWLAELAEMEGTGLKADIEALYDVASVSGLAGLLERRILQRGYLA